MSIIKLTIKQKQKPTTLQINKLGFILYEKISYFQFQIFKQNIK